MRIGEYMRQPNLNSVIFKGSLEMVRMNRGASVAVTAVTEAEEADLGTATIDRTGIAVSMTRNR